MADKIQSKPPLTSHIDSTESEIIVPDNTSTISDPFSDINPHRLISFLKKPGFISLFQESLKPQLAEVISGFATRSALMGYFKLLTYEDGRFKTLFQRGESSLPLIQSEKARIQILSNEKFYERLLHEGKIKYGAYDSQFTEKELVDLACLSYFVSKNLWRATIRHLILHKSYSQETWVQLARLLEREVSHWPLSYRTVRVQGFTRMKDDTGISLLLGPVVQGLDLTFSQLTDEALKSLADFPLLKKISFFDFTNTKSLDGEVISDGTHSNQFSPDGLASLVKASPASKVKEFRLSGYAPNGGINDLFQILLEHPSFLNGLNHLDISYCQTPSAQLVRLFQISIPGLTSLNLVGSSSFTEEAAIAFSKSDFLALEKLDLSYIPLTDATIKILAESPQLQHVRELSFQGMDLGDEGFQALLESPYLKNLERLDVSRTRITGKSLTLLASKDFFPRLTHLNMNFVGVTDEALTDFSNSEHYPHLRELGLSRTRVTDTGVCAFFKSPFFPHLRAFYLQGNGVTDISLVAFVQSPHFNKIAILNLEETGIRDYGVGQLVGSVKAKELISLNFSKTTITGQSLKAMTDSPFLTNLSELNVGLNPYILNRFWTYFFLQSSVLSGLTTLIAEHTHLHDHALLALAQTQNMPALIDLRIEGTAVNGNGLVAFLKSFRSQRLMRLELAHYHHLTNVQNAIEPNAYELILRRLQEGDLNWLRIGWHNTEDREESARPFYQVTESSGQDVEVGYFAPLDWDDIIDYYDLDDLDKDLWDHAFNDQTQIIKKVPLEANLLDLNLVKPSPRKFHSFFNGENIEGSLLVAPSLSEQVPLDDQGETTLSIDELDLLTTHERDSDFEDSLELEEQLSIEPSQESQALQPKVFSMTSPHKSPLTWRAHSFLIK